MRRRSIGGVSARSPAVAPGPAIHQGDQSRIPLRRAEGLQRFEVVMENLVEGFDAAVDAFDAAGPKTVDDQDSD
jgi:hypothetical protein